MEDKEILEKIEEFHASRIERLKNNDTPIPAFEGGKIVVHLIPFESFHTPKHYDFSVYKDQYTVIKPLRFDSLDQTYNFEGLLHFELGRDKKCLSYVQAYVNGIIETVDCIYLNIERKELFIIDVENRIVASAKEYLAFQKDLGIEPPIVFNLALLGAKDFIIKYGDIDLHFENIRPIDRDDLILPWIIINSFDVSVEDMLKINFDRIWNACGYPRSFHYDESGKWIEK